MKQNTVVTVHHDNKPSEEKSRRILKIGKVCAKMDSSRSFIYSAIRNLGFPKPIKLSARASGWRECDIDSWLAARAEAK